MRLSVALVVCIDPSCFYLIHSFSAPQYNKNPLFYFINLFYFLGSKCEKWHKEGKSLRNFPRTRKETGPLFNDIPDDDQSLQDQSKVNMNKLDKCGVQPVTGPFSIGAGSWAARIMGMYCFLSFINRISHFEPVIPNLSFLTNHSKSVVLNPLFRICHSKPVISNLSFQNYQFKPVKWNLSFQSLNKLSFCPSYF